MCARLTNSALCKSKLTTSNFSIITVPATVTHSMPYSILAHLQHSLFRVGAKNSDSIIVICAVNCRREDCLDCMQHVIKVPVLLGSLLAQYDILRYALSSSLVLLLVLLGWSCHTALSWSNRNIIASTDSKTGTITCCMQLTVSLLQFTAQMTMILSEFLAPTLKRECCKCARMEYGMLCVTVAGTVMMLKLLVVSLDLQRAELVSLAHIISYVHIST